MMKNLRTDSPVSLRSGPVSPQPIRRHVGMTSLQTARETATVRDREGTFRTFRKFITFRMFVYFCGSIRGGRDDVDVYRKIVIRLKQYGTVLTEHVSSTELTDRGEDASEAGDRFIHDRDVDWLRQSDALSAMIRGAADGEQFVVKDYSEDKVENILDEFFSNLKRT